MQVFVHFDLFYHQIHGKYFNPNYLYQKEETHSYILVSPLFYSPLLNKCKRIPKINLKKICSCLLENSNDYHIDV